jgi:hypothetical protein
MSVTTIHNEYSANVKKWVLVRDADEGSTAIKARAGDGDGVKTLRGRRGTVYLPAPNASDTSDENKDRFDSYLERANYVNFTGQTKEGVLGLVFRKETVVKLPTAIDYLEDNANGGGLSIDQMVKDVTGDVLMVGRYGLLVDYPKAERGLTEDQVRALNLRANILTYPAESVVNWRTETIGGITMLTMVVLQEPTEKKVDEFDYQIVMYHRVLLLKDGVYVQNLYDDDDNLVTWEVEGTDDDGEQNRTGDMIPLNNKGKTWGEIPFTFVGSINNDPTVDKPPLYDIAEVNIAHYRNSADYEESSFMVGQPTLALSGLTQGWVKANMEDGIAIGSRAPILLPENGSAQLLQADANQMPIKGMEAKEKQLVMLGARLISDASGTETVDAAKMRYAGQNSKAGSIIINTEAAFIKCFEWAVLFMGGSEKIELTINKEFYNAKIDPQMIMALIQAKDRGIIGVTDVRDNLRKADVIDSSRTDADIEAEADTDDPLGGGGGTTFDEDDEGGEK